MAPNTFFGDVLDAQLSQVRLVRFQKLDLAGNFRSVGQDQEQTVRLHLRLGKEQGAHTGPSLSLILRTQDSGQVLSIVLLKVLTAVGLIELQADSLGQFHFFDLGTFDFSLDAT